MVICEHIKGHISIPTYITGELGGEFAGMAEKDFTENDIIKDSCSITSRCCDDSTFTFGSVRPAELSIKLKLDNEIDGKKINKFNVYGAKITLWSCYTDTNERPENDSDKWILRGEFWVTSVSRTKNIYTLRASDALVWFNDNSYPEIKRDENNKEPIKDGYVTLYAKLTGAGYSFSQVFDIVLEDVNTRLEGLDIDKVLHDSNRKDTFHGNLSPIAIIVNESNMNSTPNDYLKELGEITAGFARMETDSENTNTRRLYVLSYGYSPKEGTCSKVFKDFWDSITTITYDTIASDGIEYSDWGVYFHSICFKACDGNNYAVTTGALQHQGNEIIDLTGNTLIDGRLSHWGASPYDVTLDYLGHVHRLHIRPFTLKCYPVFKTLNEYPKLGQKINIEVEPNEWRDSIITKMIWKFRGGWEFGCSGQDTRVLSQAAKKSLASHAEQKAKAYASNINKQTMNLAQLAKDTADAAQENANSRLDTDAWDTIQEQIVGLWNAINSL